MSRLSYGRYLLWWLGLIRRCPRCGSELLGYGDQRWPMYKCVSSECDFGKRRIRYPWEFWKK